MINEKECSVVSALLALVSIVCWGSWMAVVQGISSPNSRSRILYATFANLLISSAVFLATGAKLDQATFWLPFLGGVIWGVAGAFSFTATDSLGLARAVGTWASINTIVGLVWGALLFGELANLGARSYILTALSLAVLVAGIVIISVPEATPPTGAQKKKKTAGLVAVVIVGILWGSYFIPVTASGAGPLVAVFPMALGMFVASLAIALLERKPATFEKPSHYLRCAAAGALWCAANYAMLFLCERVGRGRGFAMIQPNLAVNALLGLYVFKEKEPGSPAARRVLLGALVTTAGAVLFGFAK
jgi:glucose uptake protein